MKPKKQVLISKREELIVRFNESARARKNTGRVSTDIRHVNDFLSTLDKITAENDPAVHGSRSPKVRSVAVNQWGGLRESQRMRTVKAELAASTALSRHLMPTPEN